MNEKKFTADDGEQFEFELDCIEYNYKLALNRYRHHVIDHMICRVDVKEIIDIHIQTTQQLWTTALEKRRVYKEFLGEKDDLELQPYIDDVKAFEHIQKKLAEANELLIQLR